MSGTSAAGAQVSPRIVGGDSVSDPGAWHWQVALLRSDIQPNFQAQFCAGTLIAPQWVLTAAHCVIPEASPYPLRAEEVSVWAGAQTLDGDGERIAVQRIIPHPLFSYSFPAEYFLDHDLALLHLQKPLTLSSIALGTHSHLRAARAYDIPAVVTGWGKTETGQRSNELMEVAVPLVDAASCKSVFGDSISNNMLCAGEAMKDSCAGDSGGPLMVEDSTRQQWVQLGVVSWGAADCSGVYGVYTYLPNYTDWIDAHLEGVGVRSGYGALSPWLLLLLITLLPLHRER